MSNENLPSQNINLEGLYQEVILEHARRPRFKSEKTTCHFCQDGKNPLCGDSIKIFCEIQSNENLSFHFIGHGCSISQASASIMCELLQNVSLKEVQQKIAHAEGIYTGKVIVSTADLDEDIQALQGVSKFPIRIKCAALAWKTLELLIQENFDFNGHPINSCNKVTNCIKNQKLKVVNTED